MLKKNVAREQETVSLCAPEADISCFGCCPPIRPPHYDVLQYVGSLRRELADNREDFLRKGPSYRPIVGYSCWGLGYLDRERRRIGCLLHPYLNGGKDLRYLIDYGTKCQREFCRPSRFFSLLPREGQTFWLPLVRGMTPFYYSSRLANPLFHIMLWGCDVLEAMRTLAATMDWSVTELLYRQPFLTNPKWDPRIHRYLFRLVLENRVDVSEDLSMVEKVCERLWPEVFSLSRSFPPNPASENLAHTHTLLCSGDFLDLLRLGFGWEKTSQNHAELLEEKMEGVIRIAAVP